MPRRARAAKPGWIEVRASGGVGGRNSATTTPRAVTRISSPARTSLRYALSLFFSSRMPTLFMAEM